MLSLEEAAKIEREEYDRAGWPDLLNIPHPNNPPFIHASYWNTIAAMHRMDAAVATRFAEGGGVQGRPTSAEAKTYPRSPQEDTNA